MKLRMIQLILVALTLVLMQLPINAPVSKHSSEDAIAWKMSTSKGKPKNPDSGTSQPDRSKNVNWNS